MNANFSSTWLADLSESKLRGPIPDKLTARIELSNETLKEEIMVAGADGERRFVLQCHIGGRYESAFLDGSPVRSGARWEDDEMAVMFSRPALKQTLPMLWKELQSAAS